MREQVWRRVAVCRAYEVSSDGAIRRNGRVLRGSTDTGGYRSVKLYYAGLHKRHKLHRLICEAFHGPCPDGMECGHLDGNPSNNRAENLAWVTRSENTHHQISHGTYKRPVPRPDQMRRGEANRSSKMSDATVIEARKRYAAGESSTALAAEYGITSANMCRLLRRDTWRHIPEGDGGPVHEVDAP